MPPCVSELSSYQFPVQIKDTGDAVYLWEIFRSDLDLPRLKSWMKKFGIAGDEYGIAA